MQLGLTECAMWDTKPPLDDFIPRAARAGYEVVELIVRPHGELTTRTASADLLRIRRLADKANVRIFSLALLHLTAAPIDNGSARRTAVEEIGEGLRVARELGAGSVLLTLGWLRPDLYYDEAYANGVASLRELADVAARAGVDIAVEFVWNGFLFSPLEMARFLDEVGNDRVGFYFDPGNMAVFQYPQHWVRILGRRTKLVHLKDWRGNALAGGWTPLLEGSVDFAAVMRELRAAGYDGPLTGEVEPFLAPLESTAAAIRRIMAMSA
jgi:L-ribulose-5-phosphate 3-epimerase